MNPLPAFFFSYIVDFEPPTLGSQTRFFRIWQNSVSEISLKLKYIQNITKLVFAQISLKSWGIPHVLKKFELE